jgi:hypothetical protein
MNTNPNSNIKRSKLGSTRIYIYIYTRVYLLFGWCRKGHIYAHQPQHDKSASFNLQNTLTHTRIYHPSLGMKSHVKPKTHRLSCKKPPPTGCPPPSNRPAGRSHCPRPAGRFKPAPTPRPMPPTSSRPRRPLRAPEPGWSSLPPRLCTGGSSPPPRPSPVKATEKRETEIRHGGERSSIYDDHHRPPLPGPTGLHDEHHLSELPRRERDGERQRSGMAERETESDPETEFLTADAGIRRHLPSKNPPPRPARDHRPYHFRRGLGLAARSGRRSAWPGQCGVLQREFGIKFGFWFDGWDIIWCSQYHFVTCN